MTALGQPGEASCPLDEVVLAEGGVMVDAADVAEMTPRPRKPTQEEIDACTHIKAKHYDGHEYKLFSAAKRAKHWQLMHPNKQPRGVERGRGGGHRTAEDRRKDFDCDRDIMPSTVSEASSKRCKYESETDNEADLFPPTNNKLLISTQKTKALTRSSPSGRQTKRED